LMDAGDFRQDLYYRINILPIEIPRSVVAARTFRY